MNAHKTFIRTTLATLLLAGMAHATWADQLDDIKKAGKIRVAVAIGTPLYSFTDANMQPTGSDVDTAIEFAKDLGVKLEIVPVNTSARVPTLQAQRADIVISALSITEERAKVVDFSTPYSAISIMVAAPKDIKITGYADLTGKRIGLTRATTNDALTTKEAKGAEIMRFEDDATLITSVVTGQVDIFSSTPAALGEVNKRSPGKTFELKFTQLDSDLGIAMNKGEPKLKEWINKWVVTNIKNGKLNAIYKKYQGRDLPAKVLNPA